MLWEREQRLLALECLVEGVCEISTEFNMLLLVFTYGDMGCPSVHEFSDMVLTTARETYR